MAWMRLMCQLPARMQRRQLDMIEIVPKSEVTVHQRDFVQHWSNVYFRPDGVEEELQEAEVHWRIFLSCSEEPVGHVAISELPVVVDGKLQSLGAIGGLFVVDSQCRRGFGSQLMAVAEDLVFGRMDLSTAILFCLPDLILYYKRRSWQVVETPVTLMQDSGATAVWPETVMVLPASGAIWSVSQMHVPCC